jgi:hypothetical protein
LLDSGPRTPFARQILKIIFACADVSAACDVDAKPNGYAQKYFVARREQRNGVVAKCPYFIVLFAIFAQCARQCVTRSLRALSCCACTTLTTLHCASHAADTRFVKWNGVFFIAL